MEPTVLSFAEAGNILLRDEYGNTSGIDSMPTNECFLAAILQEMKEQSKEMKEIKEELFFLNKERKEKQTKERSDSHYEHVKRIRKKGREEFLGAKKGRRINLIPEICENYGNLSSYAKTRLMGIFRDDDMEYDFIHGKIDYFDYGNISGFSIQYILKNRKYFERLFGSVESSKSSKEIRAYLESIIENISEVKKCVRNANGGN